VPRGVTAAGRAASPLPAPGRARGLGRRERALATDGAELGPGAGVGRLLVVTAMAVAGLDLLASHSEVLVIVAPILPGVGQEALEALEPRLAIGFVPLPEVVQEAGHRIGRLRQEAGRGGGALEGGAQGFHLSPGQGTARREPPIVPRGTRVSGDTHRGRAPRSMPARLGVGTGVRRPSRSAAFWSDDRVGGPDRVSTTMPNRDQDRGRVVAHGGNHRGAGQALGGRQWGTN
jgi:hypothetical protein